MAQNTGKPQDRSGMQQQGKNESCGCDAESSQQKGESAQQNPQGSKGQGQSGSTGMSGSGGMSGQKDTWKQAGSQQQGTSGKTGQGSGSTEIEPPPGRGAEGGRNKAYGPGGANPSAGNDEVEAVSSSSSKGQTGTSGGKPGKQDTGGDKGGNR